ncbi:MAG: phosphoribosylformylglycinamidine cyclo-ligase, partial [Verrucomicrobia bacterium]|nr:phosphoribosylformylglycinamidine cyclo-ligase [Verrucomicrobiota bacterium]
LHTNGYSLARKILFEQLKLKPSSPVPGSRLSLGEELLKVHVSYGPLVQKLLKTFNKPGKKGAVHGLAHITGGGFIDNIPRVLPKTVNSVIRKGLWPMLPIFQLLQDRGGVPDSELYQVFNMGIGMTVIADPAHAADILASIKKSGHQAWAIGSIEKGTGLSKVI